MSNDSIVILGGGQAAANAIKSIRNLDKESPIILVSEENSLPYERPPLSKKCITGQQSFDSCTFFTKEFYREQNIDLLLGWRVENVDFSTRRLELASKPPIPFDRLLIATGSKNRTLSIDGLEDGSILYLRSKEESQEIIFRSKSIDRILIIGGGFIGLELAASLRSLGKAVTVIEAGAQLMGRAIPKEIAEIVQKKHEEMGVKVLLNTTIESGTGKGENYEVKTSDGAALVCGLIIAGIGIEPNLDALMPDSIKIDNGILADEYGKTSIQNVFAAGDAASFWHPMYLSYMRLESFRHAQNHGANAGKNIAGVASIYEDIPWMWSDQYDLNIQLSGVTHDYDACVSRGSSLVDGILYFYLKNGLINGACGVAIGPKIGRDIRVAGMLSTARTEVDSTELEDPDIKLQKLIRK